MILIDGLFEEKYGLLLIFMFKCDDTSTFKFLFASNTLSTYVQTMIQV